MATMICLHRTKSAQARAPVHRARVKLRDSAVPVGPGRLERLERLESQISKANKEKEELKQQNEELQRKNEKLERANFLLNSANSTTVLQRLLAELECMEIQRDNARARSRRWHARYDDLKNAQDNYFAHTKFNRTFASNTSKSYPDLFELSKKNLASIKTKVPRAT